MLRPAQFTLALLAAALAAPAALAQEPPVVEADDLRKHLGQLVTVEGKVVETGSTRQPREDVELYPAGGFDDVVYVYFGKRAPFEDFFGVITGHAARQNHRYWRNKWLRITGRVIEGPGGRRLGVVVEHPDDLKEIDAPPAP